MLKKLFLLAFFAMTTFVSLSQAKETEAKFNYSQAEDAYATGNYISCVEYCEKSATLLGSTNRKILSLQFAAYTELLKDDCENSYLKEQTKILGYIKTFFADLDENTYPQDKYFAALKFRDAYNKYLSDGCPKIDYVTYQDLGLKLEEVHVGSKKKGYTLVIVSKVESGAFKEQTDMQEKYTISKVNGRPIFSFADLNNALFTAQREARKTRKLLSLYFFLGLTTNFLTAGKKLSTLLHYHSEYNSDKKSPLIFLFMKHVFLILVILFTVFSSHCQTLDEQARFYYSQAEDFYAKNQFAQSIEYCEKAIVSLGQMNRKILLLEFQSYSSLIKNDCMNKRLDDAVAIKARIDFFFIDLDSTYPEEKKFEAMRFREEFNSFLKQGCPEPKPYTVEDLGLVLKYSRNNQAWKILDLVDGPIVSQTQLKKGSLVYYINDTKAKYLETLEDLNHEIFRLQREAAKKRAEAFTISFTVMWMPVLSTNLKTETYYLRLPTYKK